MNNSTYFEKISKILIVSLILSILTALISFYFIENQYQTYTTIMIGQKEKNDNGIDYSKILVIKELNTTYVEILKSKIVINEVIKNLNLDTDYEDLIKKIKITIINETGIIKITVDYKNPYTAVEIANEYPKVVKNHIKDIMNIDNIQIIDKAEIPQKPIKPRIILNMFLSFVLGIMILSFVLIYFDDYINKNKKVKKENISDEKMNHLKLIEIFKSNNNSIIITTSIDNKEKKHIINIANNISNNKIKTILVDCNTKNPSIHKELNMKNNKGISDIVIKNKDYKTIIKYTNNEYIDILTSGITNLDLFSIFIEEFNNLISNLCATYDVIILDSLPLGILNYEKMYSELIDVSKTNALSDLYSKVFI